MLSQPFFFRFLGVSFDEDHDFEGPRSPKAHLDTVLTKPVTPPGHPLYISDLSTRSKAQDKRRLHPCTGLPWVHPCICCRSGSVALTTADPSPLSAPREPLFPRASGGRGSGGPEAGLAT